MLVKKENTDFNPNLPESHDNLKHIEIKDRQGINDEFHRAFQKIYMYESSFRLVKLVRVLVLNLVNQASNSLGFDVKSSEHLVRVFLV